ncbi:MAG TPA: hypothetical protein VNJ54_08365 [Plantibacter sp.]|uniref:hypothetical protein n=1 Tax=Plantibacter sp. TaxID=1871045 RepID=UPI002CF13166|nr:hypothetical protein [Plantibacter sp.]
MKSFAILATLIAGAVYGTWWMLPLVIAAALLVAIREYGPDDPEPPMSDLRRRQVDGVANGEYRRAEGRRP